ncbi:MAG: DUF3568 family protein [Lentisphaerae bacterium]|jgi:hypothetical protein|nr:DUF3568 family protein [Lentisphaerota bacterium]MBT4822527.1 DUF3568 family protein [Lentisphaerota bacterium]MBT5612581.1 DUF3568 family protein [Lentisphaerota bacterium]MBT7055683.1 DUF3568 family protein [Lentisphaerota bacterium]MBT7845829.1 DUF3568 family protein [Lentisphaerota bacterium]
MTRFVLHATVAIGLLALLPLMSGCSTVVVGGLAAGSAGGFAYERGNYRGIVRSPIFDCQKATVRAAENLNLVTLDSQFLGTRSKFIFR